MNKIIPFFPNFLQLEISSYWDGRESSDPDTHGSVRLSQRLDGLEITMSLPIGKNSKYSNSGPYQRVQDLYKYDVVECFFAGASSYLEVEMGCDGHFLILGFSNPRVMINDYIDFKPISHKTYKDCNSWVTSMIIPYSMLPNKLLSMNAMVHTNGNFLSHFPIVNTLHPDIPDFHIPSLYMPVELEELQKI